MKRSLWDDGQCWPGPEAIQGRPTASRTAPARHRPAQQWREAFFGIDHDIRGNARAAAVALPEIEAELQRQSEIARIRDEILDIAREVAELRRREHDDPAPAAMPNRNPRPRLRSGAEIEPQKTPALAPRGTESRTRPLEPRLQVTSGRRAQPVERAHRNSRAGNTESAANAAPPRTRQPPLATRPEVARLAPATPESPATRAGVGHLGIVARTAGLTGVMLAVLTGASLITLGLFDKLPLPGDERRKSALAETTASVPAARSSQLLLPSSIEPPSTTYPFEIPDSYGVYAVSDGRLTPLDSLPVRIPDARVAISSPISKPAPAPLANGNLQFVVYHRELATNVPESASVRIVAKVMQAATFVGGKPKATPVEDTWAVRGGSIDFRIAPVAANKEMILIRPADPRLTLAPGRYVLTFRNQAYDFSVAGEIGDTAHCLERSDVEDRSVYSECRQLPASAAKS